MPPGPPPPTSGSPQPPRMFGMQPSLPNQQSMATISPTMGPTVGTGPSRIDPNQIPRPIPSSSILLHETRQGNQANPPPVFSIFLISILFISLFTYEYMSILHIMLYVVLF